MFDFLTFDALSSMMTSWLGVIAVPLGFILALFVALLVAGTVVDLVRKRNGATSPEPYDQTRGGV